MYIASGQVSSTVPADIELINLHPAGTFSSLVGYQEVPDGSGRMLAVQQDGQILVVEDGLIQSTPFLDLDDLLTAGW
jgi:hypothetical protein